MALEIEKKKNESEASVEKSKGLNIFLWLLTVAIIAASAFGNIYFQDQYSTPIRVVAVIVLLLISLGVAATTNQGRKALGFFQDARTELRRIVWPSRPEATQTTFIVVGVTVFVSLILWGLDSIIVSIITFLTDWRF
ncbi:MULTISPECIES: preprotein translocase subunit SecE [Aggregatibacter]|jgi:preprotein translocase, secE subunit|uniref:Protein translocase subunit SecE n=2 Tax=Aggregatibacter segnis TaxID=739 RepID=E6L066_9PAST|nr:MULTISPECIES: preprotein translocase subunit SecE [Aggregatibacter]EFU66869.1 preprotein translocase [Aggregatibacter segnis ATCC 33393]QQB10363.1 preprotein translocase subunit SecE [Aggregatibacter segnis]RDE67243.1 preprotein translocase subunit SecE [Aggregatibacter segnis]RDE70735.1 preprotein translocase subunit SecE [Aggregatibacter segnis]SQH63836.1 Preprotein translocase subunit SecE [Aggregatibacter segnis ATCC 33393]